MRPDSDRSPSPLSSDSDSSRRSDERPKKRRRTSSASCSCASKSSLTNIYSGYCPTFQQLALEEIDLEIAIRQRIAETIQSRMTWALLLQESVQRSFGQGALHFAYSGEPAKPP